VISESIPVVLVHGWKSHPGIWDQLTRVLDQQSQPFWIFDHSMMKGAGVHTIAHSLRQFLNEMRAGTGYFGPVDMICHSMGTGIARYLLEVLDGESCLEKVRLLVGLGPPNNGSSLAEIFFDPVYGPRVIHVLGGVFVPRRFIPGEDIIVRQFRPGSEIMQEIRCAGLREDITYRLILTENRDSIPDFFPPFRGKTVTYADGNWEGTYAGDGIVPHHDSWLPNAQYDILPKDPRSLMEQSPDLYCHLHLPRNPEVIQKILDYIRDPDAGCMGICPSPEKDCSC